MSAPTDGPRYIIYVREACEQLDELDGSLEIRIKNEIDKFLTVWNIDDFFDKSVTKDVDYIKKKRGDTRGFGSYLRVESINILLVLTVFKEKYKQSYWDNSWKYQSRVEDYEKEIRDGDSNGNIISYIDNLRDDPDYFICGPND